MCGRRERRRQQRPSCGPWCNFYVTLTYRRSVTRTSSASSAPSVSPLWKSVLCHCGLWYSVSLSAHHGGQWYTVCQCVSHQKGQCCVTVVCGTVCHCVSPPLRSVVYSVSLCQPTIEVSGTVCHCVNPPLGSVVQCVIVSTHH